MRTVTVLLTSCLFLGVAPTFAFAQQRLVSYVIPVYEACTQPAGPQTITGVFRGSVCPRLLIHTQGAENIQPQMVSVPDALFVQERLSEVESAVTQAVKEMAKQLNGRLQTITDLQKEVNEQKEIIAKMKLKLNMK